MAEKKSANKIPKIDIFQKVIDTVSNITHNVSDIVQQQFDKIMHQIEKKAFYFGIMTLAVVFIMFALAEFITYLYPWAGKTSGYLAVGVILLIIAMFYKKGMD